MAMTPADRTVFGMLVHAAARGLPCPSNAALEQASGIGNPTRALERLQAAGRIRVENPSKNQRRVIIVASGAATLPTVIHGGAAPEAEGWPVIEGPRAFAAAIRRLGARFERFTAADRAQLPWIPRW